MSHIQFKNDADYNVLVKLLQKTMNAPRAEATEVDNKLKDGYFRHSNTWKLIPYDEVSKESYHEGEVTNPYDVYRYAKSDNLPKPEFMTNHEFMASRKNKKNVDILYAPGKVYLDMPLGLVNQAPKAMPKWAVGGNKIGIKPIKAPHQVLAVDDYGLIGPDEEGF